MEPFKATKLWNKIIQDFRSLMPLKRHRWRMRPYDNCFTTTEAADWLHEYLQHSSDFGPWVTRNQAVSLLEKFLQSKVIQQVRVGKTSKSKLSVVDQSFEDNGQLYRFVPVSPIKKLRSAFSSRSNLRNSPKGASPELPLRPTVPKMASLNEPHKTVTMATQTSTTSHQALRTTPPHHQQPDAAPLVALQTKSQGAPSLKPLRPLNGNGTQSALRSSSADAASYMPQCRLVAKNLTMSEIEEVWKSATLMRLQRLLWLTSFEGLLNADVVNPRNLIHNCTHLSRSGVVMVKNKEDDLPHWVLSAMKCLARWPNQTDSSLPAYPGFERDVFRTVFNYFDTLCEPLMTYALYPLVTEAFSLYLNEDQSYMQESLKLCCLLLPPSNRRKLHLLLKLMSKIEQNEQLQLSRTHTPRDLVLHTFTRCILRCREEIDLNERLAIKIVEYLMDNHAAVFSVPQDLQKDVDERLVYLRRGQIKYTPDDMANPPVFCRQISVVEYEKQKVTTSQSAMEGLLDNILKDHKMTAKEKRKKLKQFQKAYPDIYAKRMQPSGLSNAENVHPSSHCQKVSSNDYETQSLSASQRALEDLLENIIKSDRMGVKDKKKKLKRFEKEYPALYRKRLPTSESEAQLFRRSDKPKIKPPMVNMKKSFRWKSIR